MAEHKSTQNNYWMYGLHSVAAALKNLRRQCLELRVTLAARQTLAAKCGRDDLLKRCKEFIVEKRAIDKLLPPNTAHQGAALLCRALKQPPLLSLLQQERPLIFLDRIQDARNLGAILRTAQFFRAGALLVPQRHAALESPATAKAASGALETMPLVLVNIARALQQAQENGFWRIAFLAEAGREWRECCQESRLRLALVFGSEGSGLRKLTRERCDVRCRLQKDPSSEQSLNVSNAVAAALAMLEIPRQTAHKQLQKQ